MTRHNGLNSWTREVAAAFPCLSRPQATVLALYSFGAILADRCGLTSVVMMLAEVLGRGLLDHALAFAGILSTCLGQVWNTASRARCHHLLCAPHHLGLEGMAVEPVGLGLGRHQFGRPIHRAVDQYPLSRHCVPRGLEDHAGQRSTRLETRMDRAFALGSPPGSCWMERDRYDRPRVVCPLAVSPDRCSGLASPDAHHKQEHVSQERIADRRPGHGACSKAGPTVERTRCRLPEETAQPARLHAFRLLGVRSRGTLVHSDRLGTGPERRLVVCDAGLDRTRVQAAQKPRLAMAQEPDDRPRPRQSVVAGTGRRHPLRAGRRRESRRIRHRRPDATPATLRLRNQARRRASRWRTESNKTTCRRSRTFAESAA